MKRYIAILVVPLITLASIGAAAERLPDQRIHDAAPGTSRVPDNLQPMDDTELSRTRGVINAPEQLAAPESSNDRLQHDDALLQQQRADEAALVVDLDSRIQDTARALQNAPNAERPQLQQRYRNLTTLRQGF